MRIDQLPVIFRAESFNGRTEVTAVFPTLEWSPREPLSVYARVGQHGGGTLRWYRSTRPATEAEYRPLLAELRGIYETGGDAVTLRVCKRLNARAIEARS